MTGVQYLGSFFKLKHPPFWTAFLPVTCTYTKGMPATMLWHHCAHAFFMSTKFVKNLVWKLQLARIVAEIKPYSFEPMQDSSQSEEDDVHKNQIEC